MIHITLPAKTNLFDKVRKRFSFLNPINGIITTRSKSDNKIHFIEEEADHNIDDGLRWDNYGNPYIINKNPL